MERSPLPPNLINWYDILHGVGELVVDEAKIVFHSVFRMVRPLTSHGDHLPHNRTEELLAPYEADHE